MTEAPITERRQHLLERRETHRRLVAVLPGYIVNQGTPTFDAPAGLSADEATDAEEQLRAFADTTLTADELAMLELRIAARARALALQVVKTGNGDGPALDAKTLRKRKSKRLPNEPMTRSMMTGRTKRRLE